VITSSKVEEFHQKFGFTVGKPLWRESIKNNELIRINTHALQGLANGILPLAIRLQKEGDDRLYRVHLMVEELSEVIEALASQDELKLAKELADLRYVVDGTAVTYNIPIEMAFMEVHRSNMTKTRGIDDSRMKAKDPARGYKKADIEGVMRRWHQVKEDHVCND